MGFGGIGPGSLLLILLIVIVLFGTKKLRNIGADLVGGLKSFRKAMKDGEDTSATNATNTANEKLDKDDKDSVLEGEVTSKEKDTV